MRCARLLIPAVLALVLPGAALATETQWWVNVDAGDYARAEAHGALVRADGAIEIGPAAASWADDSLKVAWAVAVLADGSVAVAGDHGRIDRWTARDGLRPWVRLAAGQVFSLLRSGDGLLAGTGPQGAVFRIGARGDTATFARTGERYVWALADAGGGAVWAATGTRGRLCRIAGGRSTVVFDGDESNLLCLAADGHGGAWAGGDSKGRVYHVSASGTTTTVFDAPEDEVRAIALAPDGALWAAALAASAATEDGDDDERPAPVRAAPSTGKAVVYRIVPDSATVAYWSPAQPLVYALLAGPGPRVLAATGNRAGVYAPERPGAASQWLAPPQGQVTALAAAADGGAWAATSNPVVLWRLGPGKAAHGELVSAALDAKRFARFGHARWTGSGAVALATRSGNCEPADSTWGPWEPLGEGGAVRSAPARYLQWKVELRSPDARLDEVDVAWREQNLAPRVDDVSIASQGLNFREGELLPRSEAVTQQLAGGQKVEYSISLPSAKAIRELPLWARGLRTLTWHAADPNGDALRYRVEVRREEPDAKWIEIGKDLEATLYTWNTVTLPDGRYRVRVTASDGAANAIGEERTGFAVSEPFTVDNTPPEIVSLAASGARVSGEASDATSPIWRLEAAVDDGDWRTVTPEGGLADRPRVSFAVTIPDLKPGDHLVSIRAVDLAGNSATRALRVTIPAGR